MRKGAQVQSRCMAAQVAGEDEDEVGAEVEGEEQDRRLRRWAW